MIDFKKLHNVQTTTWITHSVATAIFPWLIALWFSTHVRLEVVFLISLLITGYFIFIREPMDEKNHREKGDYDTPDEQGITPRIDQWGDLLGPISVTVTYMLSWLLTLL